MAETPKDNIAKDEVCDKDALRDKEKVLKKQWWNSALFSMSDTFKFMAGITLAAGMAIVSTTLKGVHTFSEALSAIGGSEVGLAFLGIAAVATAAAIGTHFLSSRYYHSGNFDALELNAQHTARYLVKEIKKENACIAEQSQHCRADGKTWAQAEQLRQQQAVTQVRATP